MRIVLAPFGWLIARLAHIVCRVGSFFAALVCVGFMVTSSPETTLEMFDINMSVLSDMADGVSSVTSSVNQILDFLGTGLHLLDVGSVMKKIIDKYQELLDIVSMSIVLRMFSPEGVLFFMEVLLGIRFLLKGLWWCGVVILCK